LLSSKTDDITFLTFQNAVVSNCDIVHEKSQA